MKRGGDVANTDKQNFRYDKEQWKNAVFKTEQMRRDGYPIDMTVLLSAAVDQFLNETDKQTAGRLGLEPLDQPVRIRRRPYVRGA
jgi:hypothetical protein